MSWMNRSSVPQARNSRGTGPGATTVCLSSGESPSTAGFVAAAAGQNFQAASKNELTTLALPNRPGYRRATSSVM